MTELYIIPNELFMKSFPKKIIVLWSGHNLFRFGVGGGETMAVRRRGGHQNDQSRKDGSLGHQGDHDNPLPFLGRVLGHVRFYGKRERGGQTVEDIRTSRFS